MKAKIGNYWRPTPIFWRKLGDSLLAVGGMAGVVTIAGGGEKWLAIGFVACSIIGKFLTNFFKEE